MFSSAIAQLSGEAPVEMVVVHCTGAAPVRAARPAGARRLSQLTFNSADDAEETVSSDQFSSQGQSSFE
jgi:hypothetical protein